MTIEPNELPLEATIDVAVVDEDDAPKDASEYETRLRREVARYREQARIAQHERDVAYTVAAKERDDAIAAARSDAQTQIIKAELKTHAIRLGIVDLDALKLANMEAIAVDNEGLVHGVEDVVARLRDEKPYLFVPSVEVGHATTSQTLRPPQPAGASQIDARSLTREAWQVERERIIGSGR